MRLMATENVGAGSAQERSRDPLPLRTGHSAHLCRICRPLHSAVVPARPVQAGVTIFPSSQARPSLVNAAPPPQRNPDKHITLELRTGRTSWTAWQDDRVGITRRGNRL